MYKNLYIVTAYIAFRLPLTIMINWFQQLLTLHLNTIFYQRKQTYVEFAAIIEYLSFNTCANVKNGFKKNFANIHIYITPHYVNKIYKYNKSVNIIDVDTY